MKEVSARVRAQGDRDLQIISGVTGLRTSSSRAGSFMNLGRSEAGWRRFMAGVVKSIVGLKRRLAKKDECREGEREARMALMLSLVPRCTL